jgi:hypothetical protein
LSWVFLTDEDRDFDRATGVVPVLFSPSLRTCIVIKKNTSRLKKLNRFLDDAARYGQLSGCPILVIDDEGDQASLSPNCDQTKATRINKEIVKIRLFVDKSSLLITKYIVFERGTNDREVFEIDTFKELKTVSQEDFSLNKKLYPGYKIVDLR